MRDYGAFAAWSYRQHVSEELRQVFHSAFAPVVHRESGGPALGAITPAAWRAKLEQPSEGNAPCPTGCVAGAHFRIPLGVPGRGRAANARSIADVPETAQDVAKVATFAGTEIARERRKAITDAIVTHAAGPTRPTGDFTTIRTAAESGVELLVYAIVDADEGQPVAYGFEFDPRQHDALFRGLFEDRQLLPAVVSERRSNSQLLGVQLRHPDGRLYFASSDESGWAERSNESLDEQLGGLVIEAAILEPAVGALTGDAIGRARLPLIAGLLVLACALAVVAVMQMRREAELARMRSDFVSSVSHELRTPLAQVQLFLETLRLGRHRTEEQREWILDNMQRETTRLTTLVDNVLHFSRSERGRISGVRTPTVLADYLAGILAEFEPLASVRSVRLQTRFEAGLVAELHQESFRQVILNLLDNAVKYGPVGQQITVSSQEHGGRVRLMVEDEGPGVGEGERTLIFEPFRRGERAIGSVAVGSGIGLSVARELVEWHEGRIWVEPSERGARFVVELPMSASVRKADAPDDAAVQPSTT